MEFSVTIAFTLKPGVALSDVDEKINNMEKNASSADGFKNYEVYLDISTSIFQERWHTLEAFARHVDRVTEQYLSFLSDIDVLKLNIIGPAEAKDDLSLKKMFDTYRPIFSTLDN